MSDAHAHDHDHPPHLQHHWDTPKQQFEAGKLGMWLFLATEILLFGGLFCAYTLWRFNHPEMFRFGSEFLDTFWGAFNTAVLILSSLTMATAVTMAQRGNQKGLILMLVLTLGGAFGFLAVKYVEYTHKFHEGYFPGVRFYNMPDTEHAHSWHAGVPANTGAITTVDTQLRAPTVADLGLPATVEASTVGPAEDAPAGLNLSALDDAERQFTGADEAEAGHEDAAADAHAGHIHPLQSADRPENAHMFFNIYFMMTGLHGVHVLVGAIVIVWLLIGSIQGRFNADYFTPVDLGGLYWHVVDLIWIFLFPLFYLI